MTSTFEKVVPGLKAQIPRGLCGVVSNIQPLECGADIARSSRGMALHVLIVDGMLWCAVVYRSHCYSTRSRRNFT